MKTNKSQNLKSIPTGHKQTELGIIPEDWKVSSIGDLCVIFGRIGFRGYTKADIVSQGQGVLSISPSNIFDGRTNFTHGTYITRQKYEESPEIKIFEDDILLVKTGSTYGKIALVKNLKEDATLNPQVVVFKRLKSPAAFLAYIMQSDIVQNQIEETIVGGAIPTLSQKVVLSYKIPLPTPREQLAIANVLSDTDALIIAIEQLIAKKEAIRTAIMQQLLTGRTRLPQFSKNPDGTIKGYKSSELGHIPEDWEVVKLKDVCFFENGDRSSNYPTPDSFVESGIPFINAGHIGEGIINQRGMNFITYKAFEKLGGGKVKPNDILFCLRGSLGKFGIVPDNFGIGAIASSLVIIRTKQQVLLLDYFASGYLKSSICENMIELWAGGAAQPNLGARELGNFLLPLPSVSEQRSIATILSDMDAELTTLKRKLAKIRDIKQGMMQQLLTGRIRLPLDHQP